MSYETTSALRPRRVARVVFKGRLGLIPPLHVAQGECLRLWLRPPEAVHENRRTVKDCQQTLRISVEKRRAEEGDKPPRDNDAEPHRERYPGHNPRLPRSIFPRAEHLHATKGKPVEEQKIEARNRHERELEIEGAVIGVLFGISEKEIDAGA